MNFESKPKRKNIAENQISLDFDTEKAKINFAKENKLTNLKELKKDENGQWLYHGIPVETINESFSVKDSDEIYKNYKK
jgi:hypothetical protein